MHRRSKQSRAKKFADQARETLGPAAEQAADTLGTQFEHTRKQLEPHVKRARKELEPRVKQARKQMEPHLKEARKQMKPHVKQARKQVEHARKQVEPYLDEAMERLAPYVEEAREQANKTWIPAAEQAAKDARERFEDDVVPALSAAMASASTASEPYREEAMRRGAATVAAMKGEIDAPKKTHKVRNTFVLLGVGGAAFFVVRKLIGSDSDAAWKSSYEPAPAPPPGAGTRPTAVPDPEPGATDDAGAATPDVAIADAESSPHRPTNPDDPLENRNLS